MRSAPEADETPRPGADFPARRSLAPLAVAATVLVAQLLPHAPNLAPIRAGALFAGARFSSPWAAFAVPLAAHGLGALGAALLRGDVSTAFHALAPVVYGCFALNVALGLALRRRRGWLPVVAATTAGSLLFFLATNLAVWRFLDTYPPTGAGLVQCYAAGLPFLASGLLGDLGYATLFFGGLALVERTGSHAAGRRGVA